MPDGRNVYRQLPKALEEYAFYEHPNAGLLFRETGIKTPTVKTLVRLGLLPNSTFVYAPVGYKMWLFTQYFTTDYLSFCHEDNDIGFDFHNLGPVTDLRTLFSVTENEEPNIIKWSLRGVAKPHASAR